MSSESGHHYSLVERVDALSLSIFELAESRQKCCVNQRNIWGQVLKYKN